MVLINAPWIFATIWNVYSNFVDPATRAKVHVFFLLLLVSIFSRNQIAICGTDYRDTLLEFIDANQLPEEYGGTCQGACGKTPCIPTHDPEAGRY